MQILPVRTELPEALGRRLGGQAVWGRAMWDVALGTLPCWLCGLPFPDGRFQSIPSRVVATEMERGGQAWPGRLLKCWMWDGEQLPLNLRLEAQSWDGPF